MRRLPHSLCAALLFIMLGVAACTSPESAVKEIESAPAPVRAERGMVVSAHEAASRAGVDMLRQGGNAVDAAVATGFALAVVYPAAGNLGGGGFMVYRPAEGAATTLDFREKAPMAATRTMYQDSTGTVVPQRSRRGYLASGVPGSVAGLLMAHERFGTLSRAAVLAPAIRLAEEGVPLSPEEAGRLNSVRAVFSEFPSTAKYFTKADSTQRYEAGALFVQKDLAATLRRIRSEGRTGFYQGETARLIAEQMARGGGLITERDLADYEAVWRAPVVSTYRGYRVFGMPPPSSGGVAVAQLLNAAAPHDIEGMGFGASPTVHLMGEAMRRVYADRAKWLGDADFVDVPVEELTSRAYMQRRMASFDPAHADSSAQIDAGNPLALESSETTHYSVVDDAGNAVSITTTLNGLYGSKVVVDGAGFFLNNEMDDFSAKPGVPNMYGLVGSEANAVAPEKRMLSSMAPTVVEDPEGRLFLVIGTPGGSTIITTVYQILLNVIDHGMNVQEAISAPRIHHQWLPDELRHERYGMPRDVEENLEAKGWTVVAAGRWGRADGIRVRYAAGDTLYLGGADPRGEDVAVGF